VTDLLAETNNFGDTRDGSLAGPVGLVIILLLVIGTVLLIRNMNARLRRLPDRFEQPPAPGQKTPAEARDPEEGRVPPNES
jgi:hypothetical protein